MHRTAEKVIEETPYMATEGEVPVDSETAKAGETEDMGGVS